jgi:hypothetical protein
MISALALRIAESEVGGVVRTALKLTVGIAAATVISWLIVTESDFTALVYLFWLAAAAQVLSAHTLAVSAFYSGVFIAMFAFFAPEVLEGRGISYAPLVVAAAYLAGEILRRRVRYQFNVMMLLQIVFVLAVMASNAAAGQSPFSTAVRGFVVANTGAFLVCQAFAQRERDLKQLVIWYGVFSVLLGLLSYQNLSAALHQVERLELWGREVIFVGRWAARGLIFAFLGTTVLFGKKTARYICLLGTVALVPIVVVSNQRGVFLGAILGCAAAGLGLWLTKGLARKLNVILGFVGVLVVIGVLAVPMMAAWGDRYFDMAALGLSDPAVVGRKAMYEEAYTEFLGHPVFGTGFQSFEATRGYYPHNILLEIAADLGAPALCIFVGSLLLSLRYVRHLLRDQRAVKAKPYAILALAFLVFDVVEAQVSGRIGVNAAIWFDVGIITALHTAVFAGLWTAGAPGRLVNGACFADRLTVASSSSRSARGLPISRRGATGEDLL